MPLAIPASFSRSATAGPPGNASVDFVDALAVAVVPAWCEVQDGPREADLAAPAKVHGRELAPDCGNVRAGVWAVGVAVKEAAVPLLGLCCKAGASAPYPTFGEAERWKLHASCLYHRGLPPPRG